ncbi:Mis12-Mtw1 family protein [Ophiocordyceps sinensis CO18]|uniref:Mis12-Mtw1 family protein n=1 Tax=Ophiocordyceps sinensis (strain Co18 / CGMCC 3.14243) TaxID=911162 RepID=T5A0S1_OPHSC|nr:Mis12-Mtw1 family protein [Ophiocordyceps sinensis CO18]
MSDTPIINRNKEMRRKGNSSRRSSLGSRGRRASSLIESGQTATPHREVDAAEFYKHIEAEGLPEPRRMKQLLMWCGERALAAKPPHGTPNSNAILGARAIQDQLLQDFASRSEFSNWFSRDDAVPEPRTVVRKPNPRNVELDEKMASLEGKIKRLQEDKKAWLAMRKPPPEQPPLFSPNETDTITLPDFDLLDPEEGKIRGYLADERNSFATVRSETEGRLRKIQASLEFEVDQLADNVHKLEQRVLVAGKEADRLLKASAVRLREREQRERTSAGTRDMPIMEVLRSLSSILPEGSGGEGMAASDSRASKPIQPA